MKTRAYTIMFLLLIWVGFSDNLNLIQIISGIFFSIIINFLIFQKKLNFKVNFTSSIKLLFYIIYELVFSTLEVAWDILTPKHRNYPTITSISLSCHNSVQISLLANLISLTPGTLVIDIANDNLSITVHIMFGRKKDKVVYFIKNKLEPKVMEAIENV